MFFLTFLILGAVVWIAALVLDLSVRRKWSSYSALSLLFVIVGLVLFTLLSSWAGIVPLKIGEGALISYSVSFPHGYLSQGTLGIAILLVGLAGILSPVFAAWLTNHPSAQRPV